MESLIKQMNNEYDIIEKQLDKVSKVIFSIGSDTEIINHEVMELQGDLENLGITLNEINEKVGLTWK